jgi:hypothetical protein
MPGRFQAPGHLDSEAVLQSSQDEYYHKCLMQSELQPDVTDAAASMLLWCVIYMIYVIAPQPQLTV